MTRLQITLLGSFDVRRPDQRPLRLPTRKAKALLAFLAMQTGCCATRERLAGLLWGEHPDDKAKGSLRQTLSLVRKGLNDAEAEILTTDSERVSLDVRYVRVDARELRRLCDQGDEKSLLEAYALCQGEFIGEIRIDEVEFEEWATVTRSQLNELTQQVLTRVLQLKQKQGDNQTAIQVAMRLLAMDPAQEAIHRTLMQLYADEGRLRAAFAQFDSCKEILSRELGIKPSPETVELRRQLMNRLAAQTTTHKPTSGQDPSVVAAPPGGTQNCRIAVIAFRDLSGGAEGDRLAEGISQDIVAELCRFRGLNVMFITRQQLPDSPTFDPLQELSSLEVSFCVEGSLRRIGKLVRTSVHLVHTSSGTRCWGENYDCGLDGIFKVQSEIVSQIAAVLDTRVERAAADYSRPKPTESLTAFEHVLRGKEHARRLSREGNEKARAEFHRAINADPNYACAHFNMAWTYYNAFDQGWLRGYEDVLRTGLEHAETALTLDDLDGFVHTTLAYGATANREFDRARAHYDKAIVLNPNSAQTYSMLGLHLVYVGQLPDSLQMFRKAHVLNPFIPAWSHGLQGIAHYMIGQYSEAIQAFSKVGSPINEIRAWRAAALAQLTQTEAARCELENYLNIAKREMVVYPSNDPCSWRQHYQRVLPFRKEADLAHLLDGLRRAGLSI